MNLSSELVVDTRNLNHIDASHSRPSLIKGERSVSGVSLAAFSSFLLLAGFLL